MKPYLVSNTWVDLDHIVMVQDQISWEPGNVFAYGYVSCMFANTESPFTYIQLNKISPSFVEEVEKNDLDKAQETWNKFKKAWMEK